MEGGPAKIEEVCGQGVLPSMADEEVTIPHLRGVGCGWLATQTLDSLLMEALFRRVKKLVKRKLEYHRVHGDDMKGF